MVKITSVFDEMIQLQRSMQFSKAVSLNLQRQNSKQTISKLPIMSQIGQILQVKCQETKQSLEAAYRQYFI